MNHATKMDRYTLIEENYLKALFHLQDEQGEVGVNELSKALDVKMPTVNSMVKKLAEKSLLFYESYKPVRLTDKGKRVAASIIRKHRLTEMYLVERMGFAWDEVHEIAEQMEHIDSPKFFQKMDELLGFPSFDPHGSPIPKEDGSIESPDGKPLSHAAFNQQFKVVALLDSSEEYLKYLDKLGIQLGTIIKILDQESFDQSYSVRLNKTKVTTLSLKAAESMLVIALSSK